MFVFRQRSGFHDLYAIADSALVILVMRFESYGSLNNFLVKGVLNTVFDFNDDGFVHLVAYYDTDSGFSKISFLVHSFILPSITALPSAQAHEGRS